MSEKGKQARALFEQGYNCAQAVACAFADELGLPVDVVARMMSAFGGGIGRMREVCGAVSGIAFVVGMRHGYASPSDIEGKKDTYALTQKLAGRYREQNGSIVCRELLGLEAPGKDPSPEARTPAYYKKRPCGELVECAADILAKEQESRVG